VARESSIVDEGRSIPEGLPRPVAQWLAVSGTFYRRDEEAIAAAKVLLESI
jgi:hypothetical protein